MAFRLIPLIVGGLHARTDRFTDCSGSTESVVAPAVIWFMEADGVRLLIDSGPGDVATAHARGRTHYTRTPQQEPVQRLAAIEVDPESMDLVVLTHLHWDHANQLDLYTNAQIVVQLSELAHARDPHPNQRATYEPHATEALMANSCWIVDGDLDLSPNVRILHTPGHTPGSQTVILGRSDGFVVAGDTVPLAKTLHDEPVPNGIRTDRDALMTSLHRLASHEQLVLPSHDPVLTAFDGRDLVRCRTEVQRSLASDTPLPDHEMTSRKS